MIVDRLRDIVTIIGWIPAVFFPVWYHLRIKWRDTEMGRHVMAYSCVVAMAYTSGVIRVFLRDYPGENLVRLGLNVLMIIVVWWRPIVFLHLRRVYHVSQREARADLRDEEKKI